MTPRTWVLAGWLLVLASACGGRGPAGDLQGSLTVHTGTPVSPDAGLVQVTVLLGNGSHFAQAVDVLGDARFEDASLTGAQTVSVVSVHASGAASVTTVATFGRPELWLALLPSAPGPTVELSVSGLVTGIVDGGFVDVFPVGCLCSEGLSTSGDYSIGFTAPAAGPADVFAVELAEGTTRGMRAGLRHVALDGGSATGQDIPLDHPFDQPLTVTVAGAEALGVSPFVLWSIVEGSQQVYGGGSGYGASQTFTTFALTPPFDSTQLKLFASATRSCDPNIVPVLGDLNGCAYDSQESDAWLQLSSVSTAETISLLPPFSIGQSLVNASVSPDFSVSWSAAHDAQWIQVQLSASGGLTWSVWAPPGDGSFRFFALPSSASPASKLSGGYGVQVRELAADPAMAYEDAFGPHPGLGALPSVRVSYVSGHLTVR